MLYTAAQETNFGRKHTIGRGRWRFAESRKGEVFEMLEGMTLMVHGEVRTIDVLGETHVPVSPVDFGDGVASEIEFSFQEDPSARFRIRVNEEFLADAGGRADVVAALERWLDAAPANGSTFAATNQVISVARTGS